MTRYDELSVRYTDICARNRNYRQQVLDLAQMLMQSFSDYLGCSSGMMNFASVMDGKVGSIEEVLLFDEESACWLFALRMALYGDGKANLSGLELVLPIRVYKQQEGLVLDIVNTIFIFESNEDFTGVHDKIFSLFHNMLENLLKEKRKEHKNTIGFMREMKVFQEV